MYAPGGTCRKDTNSPKTPDCDSTIISLCATYSLTKLNKFAVNNNSGNPTESDIRIILVHWFTW